MIKILRTYSPCTHNVFRGRLNPSSRNMQIAVHVPYDSEELPTELEPVLTQIVLSDKGDRDGSVLFMKHTNLKSLAYLVPEKCTMLTRRRAWDSLQYTYSLSFKRGRFKRRSNEVRARLFV